MEWLSMILHLDKTLTTIVQQHGNATHWVLFLIVFCETGLVVTPFLPGDSLLFAAGAIAASGGLDVWFLAILLFIAAVLGDAVNYAIGYRLGDKVFQMNNRFIKKEYLARTQRFYEKYGAKTIVLARFVPIIRTFAPFLAGVGKMKYSRFGVYNVVGGFAWVMIFLFAGFYFGNIPTVKKNFTLVIFAIIIISVLPAVVEFLKARKEAKAEAAGNHA